MNLKNLKKLINIERITTYSLILGLLITVFSRCDNSPAEEVILTCEEVAAKYPNCIALGETTTETTTTEIEPLPAKIIYKDTVIYRDHSTFVSTWNENEANKKEIQRRIDSELAALDQLAKTEEEFNRYKAANGGITVQTVEKLIPYPEVITPRNEKTDTYEIKDTVWSTGKLLKHTRSVKVTAKEKAVIEKVPEYIKRKNFIAIKAGAMYIDNVKNYRFTPSIEYGHKWWLLEAGPVLDKDFNFEGLEVKAGAVVKF